ISLHLLRPGAHFLSGPLRLVGLLPLAAGVGIAGIANNAFERVGTTIYPFQESSALVTTGPFRFSRNPMYLGFMLGLIGIALLLGSLTPWLVLPVFGFLLDQRFIRAEEKMLIQKFGPTFLAYKQHTRRWL
ncbi:MAG TPA: isoprenylcysteine carboxylmethyltransferase family protein, partial [Aggregatilineaceae bacterium]|nr:isoprenylcysteine carboxylmethyltransferase family protein [Aggregatilineaceae bacterium]